MNESKLLMIIDDFFKAIYCIEAFPYPLNHKTVNIHSLNEVKMKEKEIEKLNSDIEKMYMINDFIPIIPDKNSKIYECQHSKIYKNIKKLSELILILKQMKVNLPNNILEKILEKKINGDIDLDKNDIINLDKKMNLFKYLLIKKQREDYIKEIDNRKKSIDKIKIKIIEIENEIRKIRNNPTYELLSSKEQIEKITRKYLIKKITIFIMYFRKEFKKFKITKELNKLRKNKFNWGTLSNFEIDKVIDFICIYAKPQIIKIYDSKLDLLIRKLYEILKQIEKL
tara:strand:+ start:44 stop:892 length:849 start_codon:yes stop_codon:yes gene_type:complete